MKKLVLRQTLLEVLNGEYRHTGLITAHSKPADGLPSAQCVTRDQIDLDRPDCGTLLSICFRAYMLPRRLVYLQIRLAQGLYSLNSLGRLLPTVRWSAPRRAFVAQSGLSALAFIGKLTQTAKQASRRPNNATVILVPTRPRYYFLCQQQKNHRAASGHITRGNFVVYANHDDVVPYSNDWVSLHTGTIDGCDMVTICQKFLPIIRKLVAKICNIQMINFARTSHYFPAWWIVC